MYFNIDFPFTKQLKCCLEISFGITCLIDSPLPTLLDYSIYQDYYRGAFYDSHSRPYPPRKSGAPECWRKKSSIPLFHVLTTRLFLISSSHSSPSRPPLLLKAVESFAVEISAKLSIN